MKKGERDVESAEHLKVSAKKTRLSNSGEYDQKWPHFDHGKNGQATMFGGRQVVIN